MPRQRVPDIDFDHFVLGEIKDLFAKGEIHPKLAERLRVLNEHIKAFEIILGEVKPFPIMKKHFKSYLGFFPGAKELRAQLMECKNANDVRRAIERYLR